MHAARSLPALAPADTTVPAAWTASFPWSSTALSSAGKFFVTVAWSAVICDVAVPVHERATLGGVQVALAFTWLWHWAWHSALALHEGGVTCPSHLGAVAVPVQPPLQVAFAPQLTPPLALILQSPLHVPLHVPAQCTAGGVPCVYVQLASQVPWHVPLQAALVTWLVPALPTQEPVQLPEHVPWHWIDGAVPGVASHSPVQSAEHEPVH